MVQEELGELCDEDRVYIWIGYTQGGTREVAARIPSDYPMDKRSTYSEQAETYMVARTWGHTSDTGCMNTATQIAHHPA